MMKTRHLAALLGLLVAGFASAEVLFVNTSPPGAELLFDGTPVGAAPWMIRDVEPGEHTLSVIKPGYFRLEQAVEVAPGAPTVIQLPLEPDTFVATFSAPRTVVGETTYERGNAQFVLPQGYYRFTGEDGTLRLELAYPYEGLIKGLTIAWPVSLVLSAAAVIEDMVLQDKDFATPTPATFASITATGAGVFTWLALLRDRKQYLERREIQHYGGALTETDAKRLFDQAEAALELGNLTKALSGYTRIVAASLDSDYTAAALYKAARIYVALGDLELALPGLQILVNRYPVAEYYDASLRTASDIYRAQGDYPRAIGALRQMVFASSLFNPSEIAELVLEIEAEQRGDTAPAEGGAE